MPFSFEIRGIKELVGDLRVARKQAIPHAVRDALNTAAFQGRKDWQGIIRRTFTNRNSFTARSVLVVKAKGTNLDRMEAVLGSVAPYMGDQESGATVRGRGSHKAIPGPVAAGQAPGGKRTRLVRSGSRLSDIKAIRGKGKGSKQRNAIALAMAVRARKKHVLLRRPGGGQGLFTVSGGRRTWTGKAFKTKSLKLRLLWDVSRRSVRVPPSHTLQRTLDGLAPRLPSMYLASVLQQLRRHKILGY
jgi:hypothetical protein